MSRCTVFEFKALSPEDVEEGLKKALARLAQDEGAPVELPFESTED